MKLKGKELSRKKLISIFAIATAAIMFIPMLYSCVYLGAFWDPYGNVDKVPVAFVNLDKAVTKDGKKYNIGKDLEDNLKDNKDVKWKFTDYNDAEKGLKGTKYYAMILVPENFSEKIADSTDGKFDKAKVIYKANKGKNYIFSQVSSRVADAVKAQVAKNISKESSKALVDSLYDVKSSLGDASEGADKLKDGTDKLVDGGHKLSNGLQESADGSKKLKNGLVQAKDGQAKLTTGAGSLLDGLDKFKSSLTQSNGDAQKLADGAKKTADGAKNLSDGAKSASDGAKEFSNKLKQMSEQVNTFAGKAKDLEDNEKRFSEGTKNLSKGLDGIDQEVAGAQTQISAAISDYEKNGTMSSDDIGNLKKAEGILKAIQNNSDKAVPADIPTLKAGAESISGSAAALSDGAAQISTAAQSIASGTKQFYQKSTELAKGTSQVATGAKQVADGTSQVSAGVNQTVSTLAATQKQASDGVNQLISGGKQLKDGSTTLADGITTMANKMGDLSAGLGKLHDGSKDLNKGLKTADNGTSDLKDGLQDGYDKMKDNLKFTAKDMSKFISNPVSLKDDSFNDVKYYGEGLAPYFMSLSLWLGAMFINLILSLAKLTDVIKNKFANSFIGKFVCGAALVTIQAVILSLSLRTILGMQAVNTGYYYLNNIFIGLVFFSVMYGVSSIFGIMGTPITFVAFVIQLASCAGTFPVETAPAIYGALGKYLPMTYAVKVLRMILSGINTSVFHHNVLILVVFMLCFLIGGFVISSILGITKKNRDSNVHDDMLESA